MEIQKCVKYNNGELGMVHRCSPSHCVSYICPSLVFANALKDEVSIPSMQVSGMPQWGACVD